MKILESINCDVEIADDGVAAVEKHKNTPFDIILMDCQMPKMDGFSAAKYIRQMKGVKGKVKIIALTANAMQEDKKKCLEAGMDDYVSKPVKLKALQKVIEKYV